jgi:carbon storage regulator
MLVIARKVGEIVRIGPDIVIRISEVQGRQVRLAISAPRSLTVARGELDMETFPVRKEAAGEERTAEGGERGEDQA